MRSIALYYQILLWALILYGGGTGLKLLELFFMEKLLPMVGQPIRSKKPRVSPKPYEKVLWLGLGGYIFLAGVQQLVPQVALLGPSGLLRLPSIGGQPAPLSRLMLWWVNIWGSHPIGFNIGSGLLALSLGFFLVVSRYTDAGRLAAMGAVIWGLWTWVMGQGLGGILTPTGSWATGAPGSGLLFAWLAIPIAFKEAPKFLRPTRLAWLWFWVSGILWQALHPKLWTGEGWRHLFPTHFVMTQPSGILHGVKWAQSFASTHGVEANVAAIVIFSLMAVFGYRGRLFGLALTTVLLGIVWWLGQDVGLAAGYGFNLNSAPLEGIWLWTAWLYPPANEKHLAAHGEKG